MTKLTSDVVAINRITAEDLTEFSMYPDLDNYQRFATKSAIYPGKGTPLGLVYVALKGCGETGEFAEHVGKAMRDDDLIPLHLEQGGEDTYYTVSFNKLTDERRRKLILEIGDDLWYLAAKCNELGITLGHAADMNLRKLCDRTDRGTLRGSGDDR